MKTERNHFPISRGEYGSIALLVQNLSLKPSGRQGILVLPIDFQSVGRGLIIIQNISIN
jgi:hypothetical protein